MTAQPSNEEELRDAITSILYGDDWKDSDIADDFKPDVEAFMQLITAHTQREVERICNEVIGEDEDARDYDNDARKNIPYKLFRNGLRAEQRQRLKSLSKDTTEEK